MVKQCENHGKNRRENHGGNHGFTHHAPVISKARSQALLAHRPTSHGLEKSPHEKIGGSSNGRYLQIIGYPATRMKLIYRNLQMG